MGLPNIQPETRPAHAERIRPGLGSIDGIGNCSIFKIHSVFQMECFHLATTYQNILHATATVTLPGE
jgi:hypothetical protein